MERGGVGASERHALAAVCIDCLAAQSEQQQRLCISCVSGRLGRMGP